MARSANNAAMGAARDLEQRVEAVRQFNRFYTQKIGVLGERLLQSPFSLAEARVLYELAHLERPTATDLCSDLGLDAGYLSRILRKFEKRGLLSRETSNTDARRSHLSLTAKGRKAFAPLNARSRAEIGALLRRLSNADQARLIEAMRSIEKTLVPAPGRSPAILLRGHQPGDMGWAVHRHGVLYAQEYGWDEHFEALTADIVSRFIRNYDAKRERCWIAEIDGAIAGCVFLVKKSEKVAQLRMLLVEPAARGLGLGGRLVDECIRFARQAGYRKIMLWTNDVLHAARHIYEQRGFRLVSQERHHSFGHDLTGQTWELAL
jgi:DNA-binding MarR family transcriptional regulator/N-acetylglutamate synthase-like GNAT family acetyltransferase